MLLFGQKKCEFCGVKIEKGKEITAEVEVYGLVGKFKRNFCSEDHLKKYEKITAERKSKLKPRVCMKCLR